MPELPEVETTRRGIRPHIIGKRVEQVCIRQPQLRWPVSPDLALDLPGREITDVRRRAKYLMIESTKGTALVHLGMSGSLRILTKPVAPGPHDHVDLVLSGGYCLRLTDPRRFGAFLWTTQEPEDHPLLRNLGPEPLEGAFDGELLWQKSRGRKAPVKNFIMDGKIVVGVGNIYASEALFRSRILPQRQAGRISRHRYDLLAQQIVDVLTQAIAQGGTTLRDFVDSDGEPGYFSQSLNVYGRVNEPCPTCGNAICSKVIGQRSTFYCKLCQT